MNKLKFLLPGVALLVILFSVGCGQVIRSQPKVELKISLQGDFHYIDTVRGFLVSEAGDSITLRFTWSDSIATATTGDLARGEWRFRAEFKHDILIRYRGEQSFRLSGVADTSIMVPLLPVNILVLPAAWNSGLSVEKDTVHGNYNAHWTDYPDSQEFAELGMQYTVVVDSNAQTINSSTVEKQNYTFFSDYRQTSQAYQISSLPANPYFMVFIYIRWTNKYWPGGTAPVTVY